MNARFTIENGYMRVRQCRHGLMLYNVNDYYMGRAYDTYGEDQECELRLLSRFIGPGQVILDVGANIGTHTVFFSRCAGAQGTVLAFEPQRVIYQNLCANLALNGIRNVHAIWCGVGSENGRLFVPAIDYAVRNNFGGISFKDSVKGEGVPRISIDSLNLPACHFIKIDVEGMENEVLAGAEKTISAFAPALFVENHQKEYSRELIARVLALGYRCYWSLTPLWNPDNFDGKKENIFGAVVTVNMLCLHASRKVTVRGLTEIRDPDSDWREATILAMPPEEGSGPGEGAAPPRP
jgi:FkbM family methyltransferase